MKNMAMRALFKLIINNFAPNIRAEILVSFYKVWSWNKHSIINFAGEVSFFLGKFLQVFLFSVVKSENLEEEYLGSFFSDFVLLVIKNYDTVSF